MTDLWFRLPARATASKDEYLTPIINACLSLSTVLETIKKSGVSFPALNKFKTFCRDSIFSDSITDDKLEEALQEGSPMRTTWDQFRQSFRDLHPFFAEMIGTPSITSMIECFDLTAKLLAVSPKTSSLISLFLTVSEHLQFLWDEVNAQHSNLRELTTASLLPISQLHGQLQVCLEFLELQRSQLTQIAPATYWRKVKLHVKEFGQLKERCQQIESVRRAVAAVNVAFARLSTESAIRDIMESAERRDSEGSLNFKDE
jgi:hypothetical protein